jgi:hypothetical protein
MAPDPYSGQFCAIYPLCSNVNKNVENNVVNSVCDPITDTNICRPRDASAYLADKCDGKTTCQITFNPEDVTSGFGTRPCNGSVSISSANYTMLPNMPAGGGNYSQGYYVHGIYSCVLPE